jgi:hypothetical protein
LNGVSDNVDVMHGRTIVPGDFTPADVVIGKPPLPAHCMRSILQSTLYTATTQRVSKGMQACRGGERQAM